jgi:hypothetical protein
MLKIQITQEDIDKQELVENMTSGQEDILQDIFMKVYNGTGDNAPDAFESWLENLSAEELKNYLNE